MEQLVARWAHNPKVTGSSPVPATKQSVGRFTTNFLCFIASHLWCINVFRSYLIQIISKHAPFFQVFENYESKK